MKVEIWSDIACPFCYIGKRKFEAALAQFKDKESIEIEWKSFQLDPEQKTDPSKNIYQFLAERKGMSLQEAKGLSNNVAKMGQQVGLVYHFDKTIPANTFHAHQLLHLAKAHGLQNEAEEALFKAYFTDGKNMDDIAVLMQVGQELGLDSTEIKKALESKQFENQVREDIYEAQQIGVQGVPFFVFDRKFAVSGAQESSTFLGTLEQAFGEWKKENR